MSLTPSLNLSLLHQITILTEGLKAGLPAGPLLQAIEEQAVSLPAEEASLLRQLGRDLQGLQEGGARGVEDLSPLLRNVARAVDHQVRNAHNVATLSLQAGEMDLDGIAAVLSALGDTQGLEMLERVRDRMKTAREGLLRAAGFLNALGTLSDAGAGPREALQRRVDGLMGWRPGTVTGPSAAANPATASRPPLSVLYVEDDPDSSELTALFLGQLDFVEAVHQSPSYAGALEVFSGHPSVSVLVTDHHLLDSKTGLDLARKLRELKPGLRTIFTSGSVHELKDLMTADERNEFRLLSKPVDLDDLEKGLRELAFGTPPQ